MNAKDPREDTLTQTLPKDRNKEQGARQQEGRRSELSSHPNSKVLWNSQLVLFLSSVQVSLSCKCCTKISAPWLAATLLQGHTHCEWGGLHGCSRAGRHSPGPAPGLNQLSNIPNVIPTCPSASWASCDIEGRKE